MAATPVDLGDDPDGDLDEIAEIAAARARCTPDDVDSAGADGS